MPTYRPRAILLMSVPTMGDHAEHYAQEQKGEPVNFIARPMKVRVVSNDHNHADELHVTCAWRDVGTDPRLLRNAIGRLYMGNANDKGEWDEVAPENSRFVGTLSRTKRSGEDGEAMTVELEFLDYTSLFLNAKPFGAEGIPDFSMRLDEAWKRICSQTPGAEALADGLVLQGLTEYPLLSKAVSSRFAKLAKVPAKPHTDAWAVWMQCVGMMGLISYIRQDQCIVTTATHYYTSDDPPRLIWGKNIRRMSEARNPHALKGVGLTSFDPLTGKTIEAVYPPVGDERVRRKEMKPPAASKAKSGHGHAKKPKAPDPAKTRQNDDRDWFQFSSVHDPDQLLEVAKNTYEQRSRQEVEGTIATAEMSVDTFKGNPFDLLDLAAGDNVRIEFDLDDRLSLQSLPTEFLRVSYLLDRGYSTGVARLMARNMSDFALLDPTFYVKSASSTLDLQGDGMFEIEINYLNRILVGGDAVR